MPDTHLTNLSSAGLGTREIAAARNLVNSCLELLGEGDGVVPTRVHPVVTRLVLHLDELDPITELEMQVNTDPAILKDIRAALKTTSRSLTKQGDLSTEEWRALGVSLVVIRIFISWRLGLLENGNVEERISTVSETATAKQQSMINVWLWAGLTLARITGEGDPDDLAFGL